MEKSINEMTECLVSELSKLPFHHQVAAINKVRLAIHKISPFCNEPVDCVIWENAENVQGNTYNPNSVAPPEMKLLEISITADGYTQPVVTYPDGEKRTIVDGFHRHRVGKESLTVRGRVQGYLPVVSIRPSQYAEEERMAATVRHNRARGKHGVDNMTQLVDTLSKKGWTSERISLELGMDADEVLRFRQISNLTAAFSNREFSEAWEAAF